VASNILSVASSELLTAIWRNEQHVQRSSLQMMNDRRATAVIAVRRPAMIGCGCSAWNGKSA